MIVRLERDWLRHASSRRSTRPTRAVGRGAFTLTEVVIVAALIIVLVVMLLPIVTQARRASRSAACLSNLRCLISAFRLYAQNNSDRLPNPGMTQIPWEHSLIGYCSPGAVRLPGR